MENRMDTESLLTKEKANAICEKIAKGLEENKISGSANVIGYATKVSWLRVLKKDANMGLNKNNERFVLYRSICGLFHFTNPSVSDVRNAVSSSEA
jgi:hypothetical protein